MKTSVGVIVVVGIVITVGWAAQPTPDIAGTYVCDGSMEGMPYQATVEITAYGEVWMLRWRFEPRGEAVGFGIVTGDVLSVIYQLESGPIGVASYRRSDVGWVGRWTTPGAEKLYAETLTRTAAAVRGPRVGV